SFSLFAPQRARLSGGSMRRRFTRRSLLTITALCVIAFGWPVLALSQTVDVIHTFPSPDGSRPIGSLVQASDGNFYGLTYEGGAWNAGTIFRVTPTGEFLTVHDFTSDDGELPMGALVQGSDQQLYGVTQTGGAHDLGTIFRLDLRGTFALLHSFGGDEGAYPQAGLVAANDGNFYGVTVQGGHEGAGTAFRMTPAGEVAPLVD